MKDLEYLLQYFYDCCTKHFSFLEKTHKMERIDRGYFYYELSVEYKNEFYEIYVTLSVSDKKPEIFLYNKQTKHTAGLYFLIRSLCKDEILQVDKEYNIILEQYARFLRIYWAQIMNCDWNMYGKMSEEEMSYVRHTMMVKIEKTIKDEYSKKIYNAFKRYGVDYNTNNEVILLLENHFSYTFLQKLYNFLKNAIKKYDIEYNVSFSGKSKRSMIRSMMTGIINTIYDGINSFKEENSLLDEIREYLNINNL